MKPNVLVRIQKGDNKRRHPEALSELAVTDVQQVSTSSFKYHFAYRSFTNHKPFRILSKQR